MPTKTKITKRSTPSHTKRRGTHHRHSKPYLKVYWPYVPMLLFVLVGLLFGTPASGVNGNVLAYASEMSGGGLLAATNAERAAQGKASLSLNGSLSAAAQAKANDMVARNYWSHNTPDGQEPWVFIDNTGYSYVKAGENLAYGFGSSSSTVTGWMNSPSHRANMLDGSYTEVGFGYTNSPNYVSNGQQTVVVAMYAQPQVASAQAPAPAPITPTPAPQSPPPPAPSQAQNAGEQAPSSTPPSAEQPTSPATPTAGGASGESGGESELAIPRTTENLAGTEVSGKTVTHIETVADGRLAGIALLLSLLSASALLFISLKHSLAFKRVLVHGEHFMLKHPLLDIALVGIIMVGYVLNQTSGYIK